MRIVLDTNILISGLRSRNGASFQILRLLGASQFTTCVSVPLVLEYEQTLARLAPGFGLDESDVRDVMDYLCAVSIHQPIFYLWRPQLSDPDDDMLLELAVAADCDAIVTYNRSDFHSASDFGIEIIDAKQLLERIEPGRQP